MTIATSHNYRTIVPVHLLRTMHIWHMPAHQMTHALIVLDHQDPFQSFLNDTFGYYYIYMYIYIYIYSHTNSHHSIIDFLHNTQHLEYIMNATDYWSFARNYLIWNAGVAALQFWTAYLETHVLSNTIEQVCNVFLLHYFHAPIMPAT